MKLLALSDLHLGHAKNRETVAAIAPHPEDWLVLAGDVGETEEHLSWAFKLLGRRFAQLLWVPGNHELWTVPSDPKKLRGEAKYHALVDLCRAYGVLTPEDPFVDWPGPGGPCVLAPLFLLYDYSFRPAGVSDEDAVAWAAEAGIVCADESFLSPDPFPSRPAWCAARCDAAEARLLEASRRASVCLINHFPLRQDQAVLPAIPRFSIWCGTRRTEDWHTRFNARVVVYGHLHRRTTHWRDGVRFEEVSLGYPRHWRRERGASGYLREILPGPAEGP